jgi:small subunit ribosomal protein S15
MDINMENNKKMVIKTLAINDKDTGSSEVQIGLLTKKIDNISKHFKKSKKDKHSSIGLLKAVNRRKKLLEYLKNHNIESYNNVLSKLNLRK